MGTIVILIVYLLTSISLPVFMWRRHRPMFSSVRHVVMPALGSAVLIVPFVELCEPGQPSPYNAFPYLALGLVAVAAAIAWRTVHRHPATRSKRGLPGIRLVTVASAAQRRGRLEGDTTALIGGSDLAHQCAAARRGR